MPTLETCRREIEALHAFFVDWYAGTIDRERFGRLEGALAPEFEMVSPTGDRSDRAAVLEWIHESHGREDPGRFDIEIRNVELVRALDDHALVRYEEWQREDGDENGRISTVLLRESDSAPEGVEWIDLQETALEA
ncbi:MAG: DUF4440 domain-containing protein [Halanaeroarchaeum sp.]